jgi:hypothetical protein
MNGDPENFESLRRLLALKRHESPPPGYFNDFSRRVMARIEAGEQGADSASWRTWLQRVWTALEARPAFAGAFGAAVCAFLVMGLLNSEDAPVVTIRPDPVAIKAGLVPATHSESEVAASGAGWKLIASTNSDDQLRAMFDQSFVSAETVRGNYSLLGGH